MTNITIFNTVEDLAKLTGLPEDDLFDNDFAPTTGILDVFRMCR